MSLRRCSYDMKATVVALSHVAGRFKVEFQNGAILHLEAKDLEKWDGVEEPPKIQPPAQVNLVW